MQIDHNHDTVVIMDHNKFYNNTAKEKEIVDIAFIQVILKKNHYTFKSFVIICIL